MDVCRTQEVANSQETTFLATYAVGILAEEIGTAIERIDNWLGKPIVITCNEVTRAQLPHVLKCA